MNGPLTTSPALAAEDPAEPAPTLALSWYDLRLEVVTGLDDVRAQIAAQHEVLDAACRPAAEHRLTLTVDPGLVARVRAGGAGRPSVPMESFAGWWYETWPGEGGGRVLVSGAGQEWEHALLTGDFRSWTVVGSTVDGAAVAVGRLLRELIREHLVRQGALMFHAGAAVLPDGRAVMLPGDAGAGKTSSAVQVAREGGRVVATDRLLLLPPSGTATRDRWWMVGLPSTTRLGAGAVAALGLAGHVGSGPGSGRTPPGWLEPLARTGRLPDAAGSGGKLSLDNREVRAAVGGGFVSAAPLDGIVVLRARDTLRPRAAPPADPLAAVEAHLLVPDPAYRTHWLAARPFREDRAAAHRALGRLVTDVPVRELRWSPARHCDRSTAPLLGAALDSAPAGRGGEPVGPVPPTPANDSPGAPLPWRNQ